MNVFVLSTGTESGSSTEDLGSEGQQWDELKPNPLIRYGARLMWP